MSKSNKAAPKGDVYWIAADWHNRVEHPDADPVEHQALDAWLRADPRHAAAYRAVERAWNDTREVATDRPILELRREALAPISPHEARVPGLRLRAASGLRPLAAVVVLVLIIACVAIPSLREYVAAPAPLPGEKLDAGIFTTAIGERSTLTLSDGSMVMLDTRSRIDVAYSSRQRRVRLVSGRAWFKVARNTARPFVVQAGDRQIVALGTAFDVRLGRNKDLQVTLAEGSIQVEAIQSVFARIMQPAVPVSVLIPGDSLVVADAKPVLSHKVDVGRIASWRDGLLIFDDDTLGSAIEEINRYSTLQIELADPALATLRLSGVFKAGHSQSFVQTVVGHFPIAVIEQTDSRVVLASGPTAPP